MCPFQNARNLKGLLLFFCVVLVTQSFAQNLPEVKNPSTGKSISLMKKVPTSNAKANKNLPIASKTFILPGGGTKTVKLLKGNDAAVFTPTSGGASQSTTTSQVCTTTPVNGEISGIDASNLNPATQAIFPGSIIDGMTVPTGEYRQITAARNPVVISMSSSANGLSAATSVDQPNVATIRTAVDNMLGAKADTKFVSESSDDIIRVVRSEEEVNLALNAHFKNMNLAIDFTGSFTDKANQMTLIRVYRERDFSVDVVPPTNDIDFFQSASTIILPSWTYVSSVKYGRIGVLKITVTTKEREMSAELKAEYKSGFSASGTFSAALKNKTEAISVGFYRYGGADANVSAGSISEVPAALQAFNNWINTGNIKPMPLAYTLNFVKYENGGPAVASINSVLKFTERKCKALLPRYEVTLKEIKCVSESDAGDNRPGEDLYGTLRVNAFDSDNKAIKEALNKDAIVWQDKSDCGKSVRKGQAIKVDQTRYFDVDPSDTNARLIIGGDLNDDDNCGITNVGDDDDLGDNKGELSKKDVFLRDVNTAGKTILIDHKGGGSHIQQVWVLKKTLL